jgi:hypothetical protein
VRRLVIESNRERKIEDNYKLNSRILKMVRDLLFLETEISLSFPNSVVLDIFIQRHGSELSVEEVNLLLDLVDKSRVNANVANLSETYLSDRFCLVNKIYNLALNVVRSF